MELLSQLLQQSTHVAGPPRRIFFKANFLPLFVFGDVQVCIHAITYSISPSGDRELSQKRRCIVLFKNFSPLYQPEAKVCGLLQILRNLKKGSCCIENIVEGKSQRTMRFPTIDLLLGHGGDNYLFCPGNLNGSWDICLVLSKLPDFYGQIKKDTAVSYIYMGIYTLKNENFV